MRKLFLALLLLPALAPPAVADSAAHWVEVRSEHFDVLSDASDRQARHVAAQLEQMRSVFAKLLPHSRPDDTGPIVVLALKDKKGMQALEPAAYLAKGSLTLGGLFVRVPDKNYILIRLDQEGEHPFEVVYHEYTHYMYSKADWMPLWLGEGLAEFYENTDIDDKSVRLGQPSENNILYLRENRRLIPLATLLAVDHSSPYYHDEEKGSVFYAESWALTHFLIVSDRENNTHRMTAYMQFLLKHEDPVTAAQHAWGDLAAMQKALDNYIGSYSFKYFSMPSGFTFDESTLHSVPVATPQANAVRADVLLATQRSDEAQALDAAVLREDPKNEQAHETMGSIKYRAHDLEGAKKWYGEAVKLDSRSYLAHYYFAVISMREGSSDPQSVVENSLREAIRLNPKFAPAYDALAQFYGMRHQHLDEAHMLSVQAVQLEPEQISYRINGANILMEQNNATSALYVLRAAKEIAKDAKDRTMLDRRIADMERFVAESERREKEGGQAVGETVSLPTVEASSASAEPAAFPDEPPTGAKHTASGTLHAVRCSYPTVLSFNVEGEGKAVSLYSNNYFKITLTTVGYKPSGSIDPCKSLEGMKAHVQYAEVKDARVAGQIVSIELSK